MSPTKISSVPVELGIDGVDVVLGRLLHMYILAIAPKSMQDLKVFQELSVPEKREAVVHYIEANAELIVVFIRA